jgi:cyclopropane-fatty-acyl-phospholipid synthase
MIKTAIKKYITKKFSSADVHFDGNRPWDLEIKDDRFFQRVLLHGSLGFGESYMEGWIDSKQLDESIHRILINKLGNYAPPSIGQWIRNLSYHLLNRQSKRKALVVGKRHYDLSNRLFQCMLDKRMTYSCAYWKNANNLDEAQEAKLDLVCRKLYLKPGMRVLDIGCGWGSFSKFAAEKYGAYVVGITISKQQMELGKELCKGLPVELRFQDYRDVNDKFDRVVSIGQMEHVGYKNYPTYMQIVQKNLKDDGLFLLHTIGNNLSAYSTDPWMDKYIFPNGMLPSIEQLAQASQPLFVMEDWHNFGADYDKTLLAWHNNFEKHWDELKDHYDMRFHRMWKYYLLSCAGAFRARDIQLWQIVYSKVGVPGGYISLR